MRQIFSGRQNLISWLAAAAGIAVIVAAASVSASVPGPPTVDVQVTNEPGRQPFQVQCETVLVVGCSFPSVPEGKRLVVQFVSGRFSVDPGDLFDPLLGRVQSDRIFPISTRTRLAEISPTFAGSSVQSGRDFYVFDQPMIGYVEGASRLSIGFDGVASLAGGFLLSGYLIDIDSY